MTMKDRDTIDWERHIDGAFIDTEADPPDDGALKKPKEKRHALRRKRRTPAVDVDPGPGQRQHSGGVVAKLPSQ